MSDFDYIVVGAGSAGCVLANRLSANPHNQVLLLETGGSDKSIFIKMPTALSIPMNTKKYAWQFHTQPEPFLNNREMHCPRGKVLGGSSSINGMVYVRGHAKDFDEWEQHGAEGWNYQACLPYFKKAETWYRGTDSYRGGSGKVGVNNGNEMKNPLYKAFIKAGEQAGYAVTNDYNGEQQEGFGPMHMTVKDGVRSSTSREYLDPVKNRDNLTIITGALVSRVLLENKKAVGVEYRVGSATKQARCNKEVILSAGPIGSPHILQLSGIGDAEVLKNAGVDVQHELPGVGKNLQDHLEFYFQYKCKQPITLNGKLGLLSKAKIGTEWILNRTGLGVTNHFESCAFIRSKPGVEWPDIQYHFLPAAIRYDGKQAFEGHGFQVHVGHNKPKSRGEITLQSSDPAVPPKIQFNYLEHPDDIEGFRACVRLTREIISQPAFDEFRDGEIQPGEHVQSNDEIDQFVRQAVESAYHPSCSCKMGEDKMAVVNSKTQVHGIEGLRVVDSSIFPTIPNGNLNAPTIMVAEKAADLILGIQPETSEPVRVAPSQDWQTTQR
ncbi:choline dehydrogenase [Alteromonas aestuariivivens]|uniref:Choline dehydrogenase n=1 Tax=Alteromonas aestuariivivens TaxID=1938339 RepID=A0A3D8MF48_9ALTE|nr:choline dehydrogenase [Alteromonas aestuariivivens]RDV29134.1 choline dehydrogenase [Alteromonas aestuariivivens]